MNSYGLTGIQLRCDIVYEETELLNVSGNSAIVDGEVEIVDAARTAAFLLLDQTQFLDFILCEHGDKNVNTRMLQACKFISEPVTTARAGGYGQPQ